MPASDAHPASLTVTVVSPEGEVADQRDFLPQESVSIGRSVESDLPLTDYGKNISRCHAVLLHDGTNWEYYNLGINGTFADGKRIDTLTIEKSMAVRIGRTGPILQFRVGTVPAISTASDGAVATPQPDERASDDDVSGWIRRARHGDEEAAELIWNRYARQVVEVAKRSFGNSSRRVNDEEDVALLALKSLLEGLSSGKFPELDGREQLWRLLMVITTRKATAVVEHDNRKKRGGGNVRGDSAVLLSGLATSDPHMEGGFDKLPSEKPTPDLAALMADETHRLISSLPDTTAQQIALLKMEGFTHEEIASKLACNVRTVERRLKQIRELWQRRLERDD
ncbi:MAG: ECF-type sigma factor [Planctomycetota bacterium]|jgi:DNA-directed RNA polymerase specialized sigma24 family protein